MESADVEWADCAARVGNFATVRECPDNGLSLGDDEVRWEVGCWVFECTWKVADLVC
jgi:hypothetical protein